MLRGSFYQSWNKWRVVQWVTHSFSLSRHSFRNRYASVAHSITVVEEWATDPHHNSALIPQLQNMFSKRKIEWEHVLIECDRVSDWSISQLSANSTTVLQNEWLIHMLRKRERGDSFIYRQVPLFPQHIWIRNTYGSATHMDPQHIWISPSFSALISLSLPQTSRANPVQCCSAHQQKCDRVSDWSISQLSANSTTAEHVLKEKDWVRTCSDRVW